ARSATGNSSAAAKIDSCGSDGSVMGPGPAGIRIQWEQYLSLALTSLMSRLDPPMDFTLNGQMAESRIGAMGQVGRAFGRLFRLSVPSLQSHFVSFPAHRIGSADLPRPALAGGNRCWHPLRKTRSGLAIQILAVINKRLTERHPNANCNNFSR